jgi:phage shock protein C
MKEGRMLCGVCAGIAKYFDLDPTVVRLVWAVASCFAFAGVIGYVAAALIIPEEPDYIEQGE